MLIGYSGNVLTFGIASSPGSSSYLTPSAAMADGRSGTVTSIAFDGGSAGLTQYTELTVTLASHPLDTSPPWGLVGLVNVQGLPEGTKCTFGGVTQRLAYNEWGELVAWWINTGVTGVGPNGIYIYNDVNGVASITPGATFGVGEVYVSRLMSLPTLVAASPSSGLIDTTQTTITGGGQVWELMRKPRGTKQAKFGVFTTADKGGGSSSSIVSGANPAGKIDLQTLRRLLATTRLCAVCDTPSAGLGAGTLINGYRYDLNYIQRNMMLARPLSLPEIVMDMDPFWTWAPQFQQAT